MLVGPSASYHWLEGTHCLLLRPPSNLCLNLFIGGQIPPRYYPLFMAYLGVLNLNDRPAQPSSVSGLRWAKTI